MNDNKTLTCNGTYSTSTKYAYWESPNNLTSNTSNSAFTVSSSSEYRTATFYTWHAFNGVTTGNDAGCFNGYASSTKNQYWLIHTSERIKFSYIKVTNRYANYTAFKEIRFYSGDTIDCDTYWDNSYTNSNQTSLATWEANWNQATATYYHKIYVVSAGTSGQYAAGANQIYIYGERPYTAYSYYWNKSIS